MHHRHIAPEGNLQNSLQNKRLCQHDEEKDDKQRRKLAHERDDRIATGAFKPGPRVSPTKFRADRIACRERDHHMNDHRQQGAEQELRVVFLRIDEHNRLARQ